MKNSVVITGIIAAVALILGGLAYNAYITTNPNTRQTITVVGKAEKKFLPDRVNVTVTIEEIDVSTQAAKSRLESRVTTLVEALKKAGIEKDSLKQGRVSISPYYDYTTPEKNELKQQVLNQTLTLEVTEKNSEKLEEVVNKISTATTEQEKSVNSFYFYYSFSNQDGLVESLRSEAVGDAKKKADSTAQALNQKVVKVLSVNESNNGVTGWPIMPVDARSSGEKLDIGGTTLVTGPEEQLLSYQVDVVFQIN